MSERLRLGDVLLQRELVTSQQLDEALARQRLTGRRLGEVLLSMGVITQEQLSWALSESLHIPFVELSDDVIDLDVARSLPETVLRRHEAVPVLRVSNEMTVLLADPTNHQAAIELEALSGSRITVALAAREAVLHFLDRAFPDSKRPMGQPLPGANGNRHANGNGHGHAPTPASDLTGVSQVFALLLGAVRDRASELHLEPAPNGVLVRLRIDGILLDRAWFDKELLAPITFRLRLLAGLRSEPAPRLARMRTRLDGRDTELEFSFLPTLSGEAISVRFQFVASEPPTLQALNAPEPVAALVRGHGPGEPGGLVIVAGLDARSRTNVLYALARSAAVPGRRVLTLERQVSFVVPGFLQIELPNDFGSEAVTVLSQSADVIAVEDITPPALIAAALATAEQGTLVLAGVAFGSARTALAYLASIDLRGPLLALTRGVVDVKRRGESLTVDAVTLTPALRRDLIERRDPWTSPSC